MAFTNSGFLATIAPEMSPQPGGSLLIYPRHRLDGRAVVVTADPDDILRLASAMPAVRIVTRSAR